MVKLEASEREQLLELTRKGVIGGAQNEASPDSVESR